MKQNNTLKSSDDRKQSYSATETIKGNLELNIPIAIKGSKVHLEFAVHPGQILFEVLYQPSISNTLALEDIYPNSQNIGSDLYDKDIKDDNENDNLDTNPNPTTTTTTTTATNLPEKKRMSFTLSNSKRVTKRTGSKAIVGPIKLGNYIGSWTAEEDGGTLYVRFDNSGSWLAGKVLTYFIEVEEPDLEVLKQSELKELERQKIAAEDQVQRSLREEELQGKFSNLSGELNKLHQEHRVLKDNHNSIKSVNTKLEKELENTLGSLKSLERAFNSTQQTVSGLEQQLKTSENDNANLKNNVKSSDLMIENLKHQIQQQKEIGESTMSQYSEDVKAKLKIVQELQVKLKARELEYDKLHGILQSATIENSDLRTRLSGIKEAEAKVTAKDVEIDELHSKIEFLSNRNEELKVKVDVIQSELDSQINLKVNIEKQHTVLEAAFLAANQMINKFEEEKAALNQELIHSKNVAESKIIEIANLDSHIIDLKRELSTSKNAIEKSRHDYVQLESQAEALKEALNEYKHTLNVLAPKEHENVQLLGAVKDLEEKLIVSNTSKVELESRYAELQRHHESNKNAAFKVAELQDSLNNAGKELQQTKGDLDIAKKDLQGGIDRYGVVAIEKANLEEKVSELEVKNITLESKIVDYERIRVKQDQHISDLVSIKASLESELSSPKIANHVSIVKDYENKLVNVDQGYRSIVTQLEERIALLEEENNSLNAAKLKSDKEFADLIYSASLNASTAEARIRDLEVQYSTNIRDAESKSSDYIQKVMNLHRDEMFELNGLHKNQVSSQIESYESRLYEISIELQALHEENKKARYEYETKLAEINGHHESKKNDMEVVLRTLQNKLSESADHITTYTDVHTENLALAEQLASKEKELMEVSDALKQLTIDRDAMEAQIKVYKKKYTDLAEKIDADDIIPMDLDSCHREIVSLRASRQLLQSIKKSLEDQNLILKNRVDELDPKGPSSPSSPSSSPITDINAAISNTLLLGFLFPASPPTRPVPPQMSTPENNNTLNVVPPINVIPFNAELKDNISSDADLKQHISEPEFKSSSISKDDEGPWRSTSSSIEEKPLRPIDGYPSPQAPQLIKRKEESASLGFIGDFFSSL